MKYFTSKVMSRPFLDIKTLLSPISSKNLGNKDLIFFELGREALINGVLEMGLTQGDTIIVPAYMCGSSLIPLQDHGFNLVYIDIKEDFGVDLQVLKDLISEHNVGAVLVVHYFGLNQDTQELVELCRTQRVKLIEDCSHSFLSNNHDLSIGRNCDMTIYSMRKTLPVYEGGALWLRKGGQEIKEREIHKLRILKTGLFLFKRFTEYLIYLIRWPNPYGILIQRLKNFTSIKVKTVEVKKSRKPRGPISPSWQFRKYYYNPSYLVKCKSKLLGNYKKLIKGLVKYNLQPVIFKVETNTVPQYAAIYDETESLEGWLRKDGIGAFRWPGEDLPSEIEKSLDKFPITLKKAREIILLPIHQSINDNHLNRILVSIEEWYQEMH